MSRATRATIDSSALEHNLRTVRRQVGGARVMAVVKANAYGHGYRAVARGLAAADAFAVASVEEGLAVRAVGLAQPVVLLEGAFAAEDLAVAVRERFELVVHSPEQLAMLAGFQGGSLVTWLKIDTGMNRLGFRPEDAREAHAALQRCPAVSAAPALMTHLARADEPERPTTAAQLAAFAAFADLPGSRSIANSAGTLAFPAAHADWVRPGLALFGASPFEGSVGRDHGLRPAMSVTTSLIALRRVRLGETVGYGGRWTAPEDLTIGIAAIGYGDGYPRHAASGTAVLVDGVQVPLVGRVSMDMIALDLRGAPAARIGSRVELWGCALPVEGLARAAGTVPYELLCGIAQRVQLEVG
jgi:alanine racemase